MTAADARVEALAAVPLFSGLRRRHLRKILKASTVDEYDPGTLIVREGAHGQTLFVILEGTARVDLRDRHVDFGPGEFVGELSLLVDQLPRAARVWAETDLRCLAISRRDFRELLDEEPRIAAAMLRVVAERLARMLDHPH